MRVPVLAYEAPDGQGLLATIGTVNGLDFLVQIDGIHGAILLHSEPLAVTWPNIAIPSLTLSTEILSVITC
jgi:hypothetical protein